MAEGAGAPFDEGPARGGQATEHDGRLRDALDGLDLRELCRAVARDADERGVCFGGADDPQEFRIDPIPRLIDAAELSAGVVQRMRALELFVRDVYGQRRIVRDGVVPERALVDAEHFEPMLAGMGERLGSWITVAGLDVVRDSDGALQVLEDNLRTPSGIAYAIATREVVAAHLPPPDGLHVRSLDGAYAILGQALRAAAPQGAGEDPFVVLLSDGERNSAFYEHATVARELDLPLVLVEHLSLRGKRLYARVGERERAVDVVYRRTDEDRLRDDGGQLTAVARLLLEPLLAGTLACVNAFGAGVADDKLLHAYVEQMVRYYLGEQPLLRSVPTYDPAQPQTLEMILDRIDELVIKPRSGHGGYGVVVAPHAEAADVRRVAGELADAPERFVAQETVMLSRHPTVSDGRLQPRHVDLRSFAISSGEHVHVLPGGLTRVAFDPGALVVNSSQNGGSKDTWVLAS
ncbi:MAG TPA: circularly permuted type 2 ATP-grasp protein [Solirubrobacteraceae bacterium]|nr:circularly permuted type 2 ATP-grasp protein [Solirubrobacteraceae bacterium]